MYSSFFSIVLNCYVMKEMCLDNFTVTVSFDAEFVNSTPTEVKYARNCYKLKSCPRRL